MKTVAFNRSPRSVIMTFAVVGGLVALYMYRQRGGNYRDLFSRIFRARGSAQGYLRTSAETSPGAATKYAGIEGTIPVT